MSTGLDEHVRFWEKLAHELEGGTRLLEALKAAGSSAGPGLRETAGTLARTIAGGKILSEAMATHGAEFSRSVQTMVKAGEAGGVVDVIARRTAAGLREGAFPAPGRAKREGAGTESFWRGFGLMLSSGVPVLEALEILREESDDTALAEAVGSIAQTILAGGSIAEAVRAHSGLFLEEEAAAVEAGEQAGDLDEAALRIADALRSGDLSSLPVGAAPAPTTQDREVVGLCNRILLAAMEQGASDIHLEPREKGGSVRLRVDGLLREHERLPEAQYRALLTRIKVMAACDPVESRRPQDGRVMLKVRGRDMDLRVNVTPTVRGERVVMRVLDRGTGILGLEEIGLSGQDLERVRALAHRPWGIVICTGPAGCGKTTLLYAVLKELNRSERCILTAEDPVEYLIDGIGQVQVQPQLGLTFPRLLGSMLRQDA